MDWNSDLKISWPIRVCYKYRMQSDFRKNQPHIDSFNCQVLYAKEW